MISILWGRDPNNLIHELNPGTELAAWAKYRELVITHYAALVIDSDTVAHNLNEGPVIRKESKDDS